MPLGRRSARLVLVRGAALLAAGPKPPLVESCFPRSMLSVLPPEKLRGIRCARSQELLFLAFGDRNRPVRCVVLHVLARSGLARAADCMIDPFVALRSAMLRDVQPLPPTLPQLGRARCGIVRHRRCLNPRVPRSTPPAYSRLCHFCYPHLQNTHPSEDFANPSAAACSPVLECWL